MDNIVASQREEEHYLHEIMEIAIHFNCLSTTKKPFVVTTPDSDPIVVKMAGDIFRMPYTYTYSDDKGFLLYYVRLINQGMFLIEPEWLMEHPELVNDESELVRSSLGTITNFVLPKNKYIHDIVGDIIYW